MVAKGHVGLEMVVFLFLVHLLIHDILWCHTQAAACAAFVDFRCTASRLNARLEAPIAPARRRNIRPSRQQAFNLWIHIDS